MIERKFEALLSVAALTVASGGMLTIAGVEVLQPVRTQVVASGDAFIHRRKGIYGNDINDFFVPILPPKF